MQPGLSKVSLERRIADVAKRQFGLVTLAQLVALGLGREAVKWRLRNGRLYRVHREVYALGPALSTHGRWLAAVLACGEGAVLSHRSAAALWGIARDEHASVHVTIPRASDLRRPAITVHRTTSLPVDARTSHQRIAVTTPGRTLNDLRRVVSYEQWRHALQEAEYRRLNLDGLRHPDEADATRSDLERRMKRLCRRHGLPAPLINRRIGPHTVDFCWPDQRLVVHTDGWRTHGGRAAFETDREVDQWLHAHGWRPARFTHNQVKHDPDGVAKTLTRLRRS